jgi:hypothetical protein
VRIRQAQKIVRCNRYSPLYRWEQFREAFQTVFHRYRLLNGKRGTSDPDLHINSLADGWLKLQGEYNVHIPKTLES